MLTFTDFLKEEAQGAKLKHIHHAEDRPLLHGSEGFDHAVGALQKAHDHMDSGKQDNTMTMKYDGSPAVVYGHHPENGKFFVASKSAFNKNPKINYTPEDIDKNHGHAPGLVSKLKAALEHMPKVAPKKGVYQGDLMHTPDDHKVNKDGSVSFTPNTISYTAHGDDAAKVKNSKLGMVTHTKYEGKTLDDMAATPHVDADKFKDHPDVHHHTADYDTGHVTFAKKDKDGFKKHMDAAKAIHEKNPEMYHHTERHQGDGNHLATYINQTVRDGSTPNSADLQKHIMAKYEKAAEKVKRQETKDRKIGEGQGEVNHIEHHKDRYDALLKMHGHLQAAKNHLVNSLDSHTGGYDHHIDGKQTKPEGYVVNHEEEPTKLVNRAEFAKANLLKSRG